MTLWQAAPVPESHRLVDASPADSRHRRVRYHAHQPLLRLLFKHSYGYFSPDGTYQLATSWQMTLTNGALVREILGLLINGVLCDRFGNRRTMTGYLALLCDFIFLSVLANSPGMLLASQILCGIPWGVFQTLSITYAAECVLVTLRAYLTSNVNLCWLIGQVISVDTLRCFTRSASPWSYRIPFALQWMWAVPIVVGVLLAPGARGG